MTIPTMTNCDHQGEGWCLACVQKLDDDAAREISRLRDELKRYVDEEIAKLKTEKAALMAERQKLRDELAALELDRLRRIVGYDSSRPPLSDAD